MSASSYLHTKAHFRLQPTRFCRLILSPCAARSHSCAFRTMQSHCASSTGQALVETDGARTVAAESQPAGEWGTENQAADRPLLSVAPMMDWTDIHFRQLARLLSRRTWLWTEMVVDKTILHTQNLDKFLWFPSEQRPLVLQLGGSNPATLAAAAAKAAEYGYDEINLNCGCPSDRVAGAGCFGAALMMQPQLVAECMAAMAAAVATAGPGGAPVQLSVKCRLGVDEADSYAQLHEFVRVVSEGSPVRHFIVHARKAFLNGLSPHQNRTVPPLRHQWAWSLARDFPHLRFTLNGGLLSCHDGRAAILTPHPSVPYTRPVLPPSHPSAAAAAVCGVTPSAVALGSPGSPTQQGAAPGGPAAHGAAPPEGNGGGIEGVMIGRGAYNDPWGCLADADRAVYGELQNPAPSRRWVIERYRQYAEPMVGRWHVKPDGHADPSVRTLMRPLLNLFHGEPGCKRWKNAVDELLRAGPGSFGEVLDRTLHLIPDAVLDAPPRTPDLGALSPFPLDAEMPGPTSRAGHSQDPPTSKPRKGAAAKRAAALTAAAAPTSVSDGAGAEAVVEDVGSTTGGAPASSAEGGGCSGAEEPSGDEADSEPGVPACKGHPQRQEGEAEEPEGRSAKEGRASRGGGGGETSADGSGVTACCAEARQAAVESLGGARESHVGQPGEVPTRGSVEGERVSEAPAGTSSAPGTEGGAGAGAVTGSGSGSGAGGTGLGAAGRGSGRALVVTATATKGGDGDGRSVRHVGQRRHRGCIVC